MQDAYDLILKGGTVVNQDGTGVRDGAVHAGRVAGIGQFVFMGLIGLVLAMVVGMLFKSVGSSAGFNFVMVAVKLVVLTDVPGLYTDWPDTGSLTSEIGADDLEKLMPGLESGMVPKMEACLRAVQGGVSAAHVIDGRTAHSILLEVFTSEGFGTMVRPS